MHGAWQAINFGWDVMLFSKSSVVAVKTLLKACRVWSGVGRVCGVGRFMACLTSFRWSYQGRMWQVIGLCPFKLLLPGWCATALLLIPS